MGTHHPGRPDQLKASYKGKVCEVIIIQKAEGLGLSGPDFSLVSEKG